MTGKQNCAHEDLQMSDVASYRTAQQADNQVNNMRWICTNLQSTGVIRMVCSIK